jgi:hypothetical protein
MAYVSMSMSYVEWANRERAHAIGELFSSPIQSKKDVAQVVLGALVARVEALFFTILMVGAVAITIIPDLVFLNMRAVREHGFFSLSCAKINFLYYKTLGRGLLALSAATLAPEIVYLRLRALDAIHHDIARLLVAIPRDFATLCNSVHLEEPLVAAARAEIVNWREELAINFASPLLIEHDFKIDPCKSPDFSNFHFEIFREPFRSVLGAHFHRNAVENALPHRYDFFGVIAGNLLQRAPQERSGAARRMLEQLSELHSQGGQARIFANPETRMQKFRELIEALLEMFPELQRNITELDNEFHIVMYRAMQEVRREAAGIFSSQEMSEMGGDVLVFFTRLAVWKLSESSRFRAGELEFASDFGPCRLSEAHDIPGLFAGFRAIGEAVDAVPEERRGVIRQEVGRALLHKELDLARVADADVKRILRVIMGFTSPSGIIFRKILCDPITPSFVTIFE